MDSTDDRTHGKQEGAEYNGHFRADCFHPIFACIAGIGRYGVTRFSNRVHWAKAYRGRPLRY
ncbi:MAG: transposase [Desulfobacteraceae bacterium]|nr:transposase [Desulfobacteraceae bacterium]